MKQVFVQKIVDGKPKGRKRKLQIAQGEIVFDLMEKSSEILDFPEDSRLIVQCDDKILDEKDSLNDIDDHTTFMVSEELEQENIIITRRGLNNNADKLTRTLFLRQKGMEKKVEMPLEAMIFDVKERARQLFTINQEQEFSVLDDNKVDLPLGKKINDIPDFSTLTLLEKDSQEEIQMDETVTLPMPEEKLLPRQWTEKEVEELLVLKQKVNDTKLLIFSHSYFNKVLNFYEEKGWLPNGVSIEIVDYEDSKGTRFERNEEKVEHTSTSDEASRSGSLTSSSGSELEGFDLIFGDHQNQETFESVESWTCYHHFKKFNIKFVLQEGIVKTARKIMTEESSIER